MRNHYCYCGKITTSSEISYIDRRFKNKKIAIATSSLSQNQKPTIKTDEILEREKEPGQEIHDRESNQNIKAESKATTPATYVGHE
ncbi:hypothetical protein NERG_00478 [Nematocida ausubeli]|uniref:Uncharacterized protein n=1 Tax=Nematocida ausubeli (strain ATCC PRA-371 / ERTm2) TaxID=1913371 RepID=H8ZA57_NEMA1|nr:hypothetical protein NERG_00478 [Nematocida ausubeli]